MAKDHEDLLRLAMAAVGQDGQMPARIEIADLPPRADAARQVVSGPARLSTLRFVLDHSATTRPTIVAGLHISSESVAVALRELEQLGYISGSVDAPHRNGRSVRYTANREAFADDLALLVKWILR